MRAEDLFEAIGGIDENLIARSEKRHKSAQRSSKKPAAAGRKSAARKKKRSAGIYKYAVIVLASAAAMFTLLMVRDLMGPRGTNGQARQGQAMADSPSNPEDSLVAGAPDVTDEADKEAAQDAAEQTAGGAEEAAAEANAAAEENADANANAAADENAESPRVDQTPYAAEEAQSPEEADAESGGKSPVDLLGDKKGDYVSIEYISAEDEANGGSRKVPEYSEEGERALSAALDSGKARPSVMADKGDPVYYVYLTDSKGKEDKITFYENGFVSMDSIPGMVMKVPDDEYAEVMELFE